MQSSHQMYRYESKTKSKVRNGFIFLQQKLSVSIKTKIDVCKSYLYSRDDPLKNVHLFVRTKFMRSFLQTYIGKQKSLINGQDQCIKITLDPICIIWRQTLLLRNVFNESRLRFLQ